MAMSKPLSVLIDVIQTFNVVIKRRIVKEKESKIDFTPLTLRIKRI